MLSMQLQPHFLFNTLNTIAELVHQQPDAAERMIGGLSHLLRETLHAGLVDRVPLAQELALLDRYIDIQRARFGDRLRVTVTVAERRRVARWSRACCCSRWWRTRSSTASARKPAPGTSRSPPCATATRCDHDSR